MTEHEAVRLTAEYLDGVKPDWWSHINPLTLDLQSHETCICGQNRLNWAEHRDGFYAKHGGQWAVFAYRGLEPFWLEEIAQRMPTPVGAPEKVLA